MSQFLRDDAGHLSSNRLAFLVSVMVVVGTWAIVSFRVGVIQSMDTGSVALVLGLAAAKAAQKFGEDNGRSL